MKRTRLKAGTKHLARRKRINPVSKKRRDARPEHDAVVAAVFERDQGCRFLSFRAACEEATRPALTLADLICFGPPTPHHLKKASAGGLFTLDNLVQLCAAHNDWVEDHPKEATTMGLVIR